LHESSDDADYDAWPASAGPASGPVSGGYYSSSSHSSSHIPADAGVWGSSVPRTSRACDSACRPGSAWGRGTLLATAATFGAAADADAAVGGLIGGGSWVSSGQAAAEGYIRAAHPLHTQPCSTVTPSDWLIQSPARHRLRQHRPASAGAAMASGVTSSSAAAAAAAATPSVFWSPQKHRHTARGSATAPGAGAGAGAGGAIAQRGWTSHTAMGSPAAWGQVDHGFATNAGPAMCLPLVGCGGSSSSSSAASWVLDSALQECRREVLQQELLRAEAAALAVEVQVTAAAIRCTQRLKLG
jgi:hypothetical protein